MASVTIRASSLPELFDCPARWEAKNIKKLFMPKTPRAALGTAVHKSTAVFDQSTLDGAGLTVDEAAAAAVDAIYKPEEETDWSEESQSDIEKIAISATAEEMKAAYHKCFYQSPDWENKELVADWWQKVREA